MAIIIRFWSALYPTRELEWRSCLLVLNSLLGTDPLAREVGGAEASSTGHPSQTRSGELGPNSPSQERCSVAVLAGWYLEELAGTLFLSMGLPRATFSHSQ